MTGQEGNLIWMLDGGPADGLRLVTGPPGRRKPAGIGEALWL
jgi:hypothetical protein